MLLLHILLLFGAYCQAEVYYVTTDGEDCSNCHPLSYYTTLSQWPPNVTLIFLKGEHKLKDNPLVMAGLESVTLQGPPQHNRSLGDATISCDKINEPNAIVIANISSTVHIERLTMDCHNNILVHNITSVVITSTHAQRLSVQGNNVSTKVVISQSTFIAWQKTPSLNKYAVFIYNASTVNIKDALIANIHGRGLALIHNGNRIILRNVTITNSSTVGLLMGSNGNNIILNKVKVDSINGLGFYMISNGDYITLSDFKVTNTKSMAFYMGKNGNNINLTDVTVANTSNSEGMRIEENGNNIKLVNIVASNNSASGLRLNNNGFFISLNNVTCSYTQGIGLSVDSNQDSIALNDIKLISNKYGGLYLDKNGNNIHVNNLMSINTASMGLRVSYNGHNVTISNIVMDNNNVIGVYMIKNGNGLILSNAIVNNTNSTALYMGGNGNNATIYDTEVHNSGYKGIQVESNGIGTILHNITVKNCNYASLIVLSNLDHLTIKDIVIHGSTETSVYVVSNRNHITLSNIEVMDSRSMSLYIGSNGNHITITNVTIANNAYGIRIEDNKNYIVLSNILATNNNSSGIRLNNNGFSISLNNVTCNNTQMIGLSLDNNKHSITLNNVVVSNSLAGGLSIDSNGDNIQLYNVTVTNNNGGGVTMTYNRNLIVISNLSVINNTDTGMYIDGVTNVTFTNQSSTLINNSSPGNGGGMWIGKDIVIGGEAIVSFYNNKARGVGGAVYVDTRTRGVKNCTFLYLTPKFKNNSGEIAGNDIYGGTYSSCIGRIYIYHIVTKFMEAINCYNSNNNYLFRNFPTPISSHVTSSPIGVCLCTSNSVIDCTNRSINRELYSGQSITLPIITVGVCGGISPGEIVTNNINAGVQVILNDTNQETLKQCKNFTYQLLQQSVSDSRDTLTLQHKLVPDKETNFLSHSELTVNITFLPCPLGLDLEAKRCHCNDIIGGINGTECNVDWMPYPIMRYGNNWLHYSQEYNCIVAHSTCPFDYCDTSTLYLNLNDSDIQCISNRSGILCGQCQTGLSLMLGSNKCSSCTNNYLSLLIAFVAAGVVLVAFLMVCNLTVSVGSINGLLFYANIVKLNQTVLFPDGTSIPVLSQFIAWLNLDLGIQTCFFNGLDGYWKTWLQFVFPLYIWLLIGFLIIGSHYSGRLSRLCGNNAVPVLATLVLMSYTKLLGTITNVLMRDTVDCEGTAVWSVWSVDGNIGYLSGKHIPLFVVALLFLFIGLVYTGLVFSAQWLQRYSGKCCRSSRDPVVKLKPFIDAYTGPYEDKYRFWTGLLLIVRLILTPVFSYTTGSLSIVNNYIIALIAFIIMIFMSVYRKKHINVLEYFYFLNLSVLSLFSAVCNDYGLSAHSITIVTGVSVSLAMVAFLATVVAHIYAKFSHSKKVPQSSETFNFLSDVTIQKEKDITDEGSPARLIMRRESLIFDFQR